MSFGPVHLYLKVYFHPLLDAARGAKVKKKINYANFDNGLISDLCMREREGRERECQGRHHRNIFSSFNWKWLVLPLHRLGRRVHFWKPVCWRDCTQAMLGILCKRKYRPEMDNKKFFPIDWKHNFIEMYAFVTCYILYWEQ